MSCCCSSHCDRFTICVLAYESGTVVNWHDYGYGGIGSPGHWYCGTLGNYGMFEPVNPEILLHKIKFYQDALEELKRLTDKEELKYES